MEIEQKLVLEQKKNESLINENDKLKIKQRQTRKTIWEAWYAAKQQRDSLLELELKMKKEREKIDALIKFLSDFLNSFENAG